MADLAKAPDIGVVVAVVNKGTIATAAGDFATNHVVLPKADFRFLDQSLTADQKLCSELRTDIEILQTAAKLNLIPSDKTLDRFDTNLTALSKRIAANSDKTNKLVVEVIQDALKISRFHCRYLIDNCGYTVADLEAIAQLGDARDSRDWPNSFSLLRLRASSDKIKANLPKLYEILNSIDPDSSAAGREARFTVKR